MLQDLGQFIRTVRTANMAVGDVYARKRPVGTAAVPAGAIACPICHGHYRRFLPFGLDGRRNARCPGCGSLERHRFMWMYMRDRHRLLERRLRLLHIAPEHCIRNALGANPALSYVSVDMFDPDADHEADMTALPFPDSSFNFAICSHVLEHIDEDGEAMAELNRVLVPGGRAIVMVPIDMNRAETYEDFSIDTAAGRDMAFGHPYHVRICGADYPDRLRAAGFDVKTIDSRAMSAHWRRFWRINKTMLFDCRKI